MFAAPAVAWSTTDRAGWPHLLAEVVATAGLMLVIFALVRTGRSHLAAPAVGAYIGAAYFFTSSTSFANPAITIGRMFSGHVRRHRAGIAYCPSSPLNSSAPRSAGCSSASLFPVTAPEPAAPRD